MAALVTTLLAIYVALAATTYVILIPAQLHVARHFVRIARKGASACAACREEHTHDWYEAFLEIGTFTAKAVVASVLWPYAFYRLYRTQEDT